MSIAHDLELTHLQLHNAVESAVASLKRKNLPVDAADARQEAWVAFLEAMDRYRPERGRLYSYARTIAKLAAHNHATWSSSPLTLSKSLVESGGRVVQDRYSRAFRLDAPLASDDGGAEPALDRAVVAGLPYETRDPESVAHERAVADARRSLRRRGLRVAIRRCTEGMEPNVRAAVSAVARGTDARDAAEKFGVNLPGLHGALREFAARARGDLALAVIASELGALD